MRLIRTGCTGPVRCGGTGYDKGKHAVYAVHDGTQARLVETKPFFDEAPLSEPS